jgi:hypothetical protein
MARTASQCSCAIWMCTTSTGAWGAIVVKRSAVGQHDGQRSGKRVCVQTVERQRINGLPEVRRHFVSEQLVRIEMHLRPPRGRAVLEATA